jgi:hypothetical protein
MSTTKARIRAEWTPHPAQGEIMASDARFRVIACGRRFGKTTLAARETAQYLGQPEALVWWVAPTYDEADRGFDAVTAALPDPLIADTTESWPKAVDVVNGARIEFRSTERQNSNRGEGLDLLVLDEADDIRDAAWTEDLRPSLSDTLGDMIAISTPMRKGWFYRWWQRGQSPEYPDAASWRFPTAANPHIPASEIEAAKTELPGHAFEQEYEAEFKDETGGVFTDLDDTLFTREYDLTECDGEPPYATGVDFARHQDWRVIVTLDAHGDLVHYDRQRVEAWPHIQRRVEAVASEYEGPVAVDASRDNKIVSDLAEAGLNIQPVQFSPKRKRELIENLAAAIESEELTAPDIPQLRHELEIFEYDVTSAGNVRYHAPEGFHDDCVDALALAQDAMNQQTE